MARARQKRCREGAGMKKRVEVVRLGVLDALTAPGCRCGDGRVQRRGQDGASGCMLDIVLLVFVGDGGNYVGLQRRLELAWRLGTLHAHSQILTQCFLSPE
jgi:hypothetical protein